MVLDIKLFRKDQGGNPDLIKESQKRRFKPTKIVDDIVELDEKWRKLTHEISVKRREKNDVSKEVGKKAKAKEDTTELIEKAKKIEEEIKELENTTKNLKEQIDKLLIQIGNIVHESVPVSDDEDNNGKVKEWGEFKVNEKANLHHHELLAMIGGYDGERGVKVAGHRAYFLKGPGVLLNQALINYGISFLTQKGYTAVQTPFFMNKDQMARTAQLEQFDEELYKVTGEGTEEKYLIATSEQPISAFHANEWMDKKSLPIRYCGYSTNFRKEAGSHGKDTWGIFRVHQFEKIEQFVITAPDKSWEEHEAMLAVSEEFYQSLKLPYRVVTIVSGALNNAAAKKYDLEAWFPSFSQFRELVSCSNCTDYQSRSLEVRYGQKQKGDTEKKYVHMLNSTLTATERTLCCILENYQRENGIEVPEVLRPFMGGLDFIPFTEPKPTTTNTTTTTTTGQKKNEK